VELADLMEKRREMRELIDEAQRILGKMFNPSEVNILVGMVDYLGMSEECILLLLAHCQKIEKKSLRAVEKYALHLADKGVVSFEAMEEEIRIAEAMYTFEGQIRSLFGLGKRALTTKEKKMLGAWVSFGYDIEIVRIAYEMTANATGEASLPYANSILERWNAEGLKDAKAIEAYNEQARAKREGKKGAKTGLGNSFETDDFFEAALRRTFADTKES
jgi:DnaD/phage-associated family protein